MTSVSEARSLLSQFGETTYQPLSDWKGPFPLPSAVQRFYETIGPVNVTIPGYGNPYFFPSLAALWNYQAGYKYHPKTGETFDAWKRNWLVIASEGGDPFIFDMETGRICRALHGEGTWKPDEIFPDLASMVASLALIGSVVDEAGQGLTDNNADIKGPYLSEARIRLKRVLESDARVESTLTMLGWM